MILNLRMERKKVPHQESSKEDHDDESEKKSESEEGDEDHEMQHGAAPEENELTDEVPS